MHVHLSICMISPNLSETSRCNLLFTPGYWFKKPCCQTKAILIEFPRVLQALECFRQNIDGAIVKILCIFPNGQGNLR